MVVSLHAGEFEDNGERDSARDEESEVFHRDVEQNVKSIERLFLHGRSPLLCMLSFRIGIFAIPCHPFFVFELTIAYHTVIGCQFDEKYEKIVEKNGGCGPQGRCFRLLASTSVSFSGIRLTAGRSSCIVFQGLPEKLIIDAGRRKENGK